MIPLRARPLQQRSAFGGLGTGCRDSLSDCQRRLRIGDGCDTQRNAAGGRNRHVPFLRRELNCAPPAHQTLQAVMHGHSIGVGRVFFGETCLPLAQFRFEGSGLIATQSIRNAGGGKNCAELIQNPLAKRISRAILYAEENLIHQLIVELNLGIFEECVFLVTQVIQFAGSHVAHMLGLDEKGECRVCLGALELL